MHGLSKEYLIDKAGFRSRSLLCDHVKCQPNPGSPPLRLDSLLPLKMVDNHIRLTYNEIHKLIGASSAQIQEEFAPDVLIAIGSVPIMIL